MKRGLVLIVLTGAISACGSPSAELFTIEVSGPDPNANYTLVASDGGTVTCNGGEPRRFGDQRLIDARQLARDLSEQAEFSIDLPPEPNSILRYEVEVGQGRLAFSDTSKDKPPAFSELMAFSTDVAENVCGLER